MRSPGLTSTKKPWLLLWVEGEVSPEGRVCKKTCELDSYLCKQADGAGLTEVFVSYHWSPAPSVFLGCLIPNEFVAFFQLIWSQSNGWKLLKSLKGHVEMTSQPVTCPFTVGMHGRCVMTWTKSSKCSVICISHSLLRMQTPSCWEEEKTFCNLHLGILARSEPVSFAMQSLF